MIGWISSSLLVVWIGTVCAPRRSRFQIVVPLAALGVACLPLVAGGSVLGWLRGVVGDLALPTLFLIADSVQRRVRGRPIEGRTHGALLTAAAVLAVFFYPPALGVCSFDPYPFGYGSRAMLAGAFAVAALLWWRRRESAALVMMAAVLAWRLGIGESGNLWDYLLDPLLVVFGIGWTASQLIVRRLKARAS